MDNVTDVLRAQSQMAWKEVAQRVAHEIKNPLTPIALSAERIRRHVDRNLPGIRPRCCAARRSHPLFRGNDEPLVDQFAVLADFPAANRNPSDLNRIIENTVMLFAGRLERIEVASLAIFLR